MRKKLIMLTIAITAGAFFVSCNKDYDCVCELNGVETNRYSVRAKTKNSAEDECNQKQSALGSTYQCYIE